MLEQAIVMAYDLFSESNFFFLKIFSQMIFDVVFCTAGVH